MFLSLDGTFWLQLIDFAIFFALLNVLFIRPVSRAIVKRREYLNQLVSDYDSFQAQANALRRQAEQIRADARREAELKIARARADASNRAAELAAEYNARVQAIVAEAQQRALAELEKARANEEPLVAQLTGLMVDRAVGEAAA
jgi:F-type H+-transporting ATPase subunit b